MIVIVVFLIQAIDCGEEPLDPHALITSWTPAANSNGFNTSISYTCNTGYWYYRSVYEISVVCNATGYWSPSYQPCTGKADSSAHGQFRCFV